MSLSPVSCSSGPLVHSSRLEELIAGLTALAQYTAQLLPGPHTAQPSHSAIRPPSRFLHRSPLSCHSLTIRVASFLTPFEIYRPPARQHCHPSLIIFFLPPFSLIHLPAPILSFPPLPWSTQFTVSPFPLSSLATWLRWRCRVSSNQWDWIESAWVHLCASVC